MVPPTAMINSLGFGTGTQIAISADSNTFFITGLSVRVGRQQQAVREPTPSGCQTGLERRRRSSLVNTLDTNREKGFRSGAESQVMPIGSRCEARSTMSVGFYPVTILIAKAPLSFLA
jgi:hypothetical protein